MGQGQIAVLADRGVVAVNGPDARHFLQNLVTNDLDGVAGDRGGYGALLTPQGKILFDFVIFPAGEGFLLDVARSHIADLLKRLGLYRLRAKVELHDLSATHRVLAAWGGDEPPHIAGAAVVPDPRLPALGFRVIAPAATPAKAPHYAAAPPEAYHRHRIGLGVPEGGIDFAFGDFFPHDGDLDQLGGVAFDKGCYVGQEVVSRMEHRGTARRRIVRVSGSAVLPPKGAEITAAGRPLGTLGSSAGEEGLALVRLDRARAAIDAGIEILAAGVPVTLALPDWARFRWPAGAGAE